MSTKYVMMQYFCGVHEAGIFVLLCSVSQEIANIRKTRLCAQLDETLDWSGIQLQKVTCLKMICTCPGISAQFNVSPWPTSSANNEDKVVTIMVMMIAVFLFKFKFKYFIVSATSSFEMRGYYDLGFQISLMLRNWK